jgi:hypothetical protein
VNRAVCIACVLVSNAAFADDDAAEVAAPEPISTPLVLVGAGTSIDGPLASAAIGWGWGTHEGGLFPGSELVRVLAGGALRSGSSTGALTIGWYRTAVIDLGFDAGAAARRDALGPMLRITLGVHGLDARFSVASMFSSEPVALDGSVEVVLDVMELAGRL